MEADDVTNEVVTTFRLSQNTITRFKKFRDERGVTADRALRMLLSIWDPKDREAE